MDRDRNTLVETLFSLACDEPPAERAAYLDRACAGKPELRAEVESLLRADSSAGAFLETPVAQGSAVRATPAPSLQAGQRLGAYEIIAPIAAGGMGAVYKARQASPSRVVALKIARSGLFSSESRRRFQFEAELLGRLAHPHIAQIHEAATDVVNGVETPYFAMEYVADARPIHTHANAKGLDLRRRLELFLDACDAVQHGHQRGVVHRDLKPGNILVDAHDRVKVIDFGVARLVEADANATTLRTNAGQLVGTLAYMSPEQSGADPRDIDTRADVYSLGVVLYELLCGCPPVDLSGLSIPDALRVARESEPTKPSAHVSALRGDLETILLTALEKDPARRYMSAGALASDIRRYLRNEPITARPASAIYHLRKFAARRRALAAGASIAAIGLLIGAGLATVWAIQSKNLAVRAQSAERKARDEAETAQRIAEFQRDLIAAAMPVDASGDVTVREILGEAARQVGDALGDNPAVQAAIRDSLGQSYLALGAFSDAEAQFDAALSLRMAHLGPRHPDTLDIRHNLAALYLEQGRFDDAEAALREVITARESVLGADHPGVFASQAALGAALYHQRRHAESAQILDTVLTAPPNVLPDDADARLDAMNTLAIIRAQRDDFDGSATLLTHVLQATERMRGPEHPLTLRAMNNLARLHDKRGDFESAATLFRRVFESRERVLGRAHPDTLTAIHNLAAALQQLERWDEAEALSREAVDGRRAALGIGHPHTTSALRILGQLLLEQQRMEEALPVLREAYTSAQAETPLSALRTALDGGALGDCLLALGNPDEARPLLEARADAAITRLGLEHPRTVDACAAIIAALEAIGDTDAAAGWRARGEGRAPPVAP